MCMRWVSAIIEDYMMVEYVDLPRGSDTWPFLKRWWIVVAKLTENIVCWFLIEFLLYTSILWWTVTYSWEVYNKSDILHNKGCHHKGQYNVMFSCIKGFGIQKNKCMTTSASLCEGPIFYFSVFTFIQRVKVFLSIPFIFLLWQASCGEKRSRHICPVEYGWHQLLLLTSPLRWVRWEAKL